MSVCFQCLILSQLSKQAGVELVARVPTLGDDALHLLGSGRLKQRFALPLHGQRRHDLRARVDQLLQSRLTLGQRFASVVPVGHQHVERYERGRDAPRRRGYLARVCQQSASGEVVEDRPAIAQADPFAIEHGGTGADRGTGGLKLRELAGDAVAVPGERLYAVSVFV